MLNNNHSLTHLVNPVRGLHVCSFQSTQVINKYFTRNKIQIMIFLHKKIDNFYFYFVKIIVENLKAVNYFFSLFCVSHVNFFLNGGRIKIKQKINNNYLEVRVSRCFLFCCLFLFFFVLFLFCFCFLTESIKVSFHNLHLHYIHDCVFSL